MPLKNLVGDIKDLMDGIGSMSRRTLEGSFSHSRRRVRSQSAVLQVLCAAKSGSEDDKDEFSFELSGSISSCKPGCWSSLPLEIVRDVLQRVESAEGLWPARKDVVACSAVCRSWREITKELVKIPEESGKLTFPISLKQPGPRNAPMQCFIKRDRASSTFYLYLGLSPSLHVENSKFLLAARKLRRATCTDYIISLNADDMSRGSSCYIGKLRSNFLGTKFVVYDSQPPFLDGGASVASSGRVGGDRRIGSRQVSPNKAMALPTSGRTYPIAHIGYELNVLGTRGPRRMQCILHSIPASAIEVGGSAPTPTAMSSCTSVSVSMEEFLSSAKVNGSYMPSSSADSCSKPEAKIPRAVKPLVLKNKAPRWHEQLQCWCLNFRGRVTVASVKNFQLVPAIDPSNLAVPQSEQDKVLLQFGKIGKDIFTMDYRYPLSAFQAFTICLSSFDTKLACE